MKKLYKLFLISLLFTFPLNEALSQVNNINFEGGQPSCFQSTDGFLVFKGFDFVPGRPAGPNPNFTFGFPGTPPTRIPISVGDTIKNLVSGSYFIEVIDNGSYFREDSTLAFVTSISSFKIPTAVSCFSESDGNIQLFPNGGNGAPFTFTWDDPAMSTTQNLTGVPAGTYNVTITDSKGCVANATDSVGSPSQININLTIDSIDCNGGVAIATITPTGGGNNYPTVEWSSTGINTTATRFTEGGLTGTLTGTNYSVTVTDNSGCTAVESFTIIEPAGITISVAPDTIDCFGTNTGTAVATVNGGTPPYSYVWNGLPGTGSNSDNNLFAGAYTLQVVDDKGCTTPVTPFRIEERDEFNLGLDSTDVSCFLDGDGTVTGTITGGVAPYSWVADDPAGTTGNSAAINVTGLDGNRFYRVTVTDNLGCPKVDSIFVNEPTELVASFLNTTADPTCAGTPTGIINVTFSGGNGSEAFSWTGPSINVGNQNQRNLSNLLAGRYDLIITDSKGCTVTIDTTLVDPNSILGGLTFDPPSCFGGNDGRVVSTPSQGSGVYTNYQFGDGTTTLQNGTDSILTGLSAGNYFVTITDNAGCDGFVNITVNEPTVLFEVDVVADSVNCNGESTGGATATPSSVPLTGGPYTWSWTNSSGTPIGTGDSTISGLPVGKYFITARDGNGCQILDSVIIEQPDPINTAIVGTNLNCNGDGSGTATATISNGNTPYSWSWNTTPAQTGTGALAAAAGLDANVKYILTVTDRKGCTKKDSIVLTEPTNFDLFLDSFKLVKCFGENNGAMFLSDSGGTAGAGFPTYVWSDGPASTQDRTDLTASATPYKIVATDANGCKDSVIQTIAEPIVLAVSIIDSDSVRCNGANDGTATALATGGTIGNGYIYTWNTVPVTVPVQIGGTATGLSPGTYTVQVTDSNGCQETSLPVTIFQPTSITTTMASDSASCSGFNDGTATVTASGGTPFSPGSTYTYLWDAAAGGQTTATATNLLANAPAFYVVTVTDQNGCEKLDSVQVGQPNTLTLSIGNQSNVKCAGDLNGAATINVLGGSLPYTYVWENTGNLGVDIGSNNPTLSGLPADTFRVTVTDGGGCNDNIQVIITQPDSLKGSVTASISPSCLGSTDGSATVTGTGGSLLPASNYSYSWNTVPVQNTQTATGLEADLTYVVTITDDSSCFTTVNVILSAPNVFVTSDSNVQNVSCFGGNDGFIRLTPTGGAQFLPPANPYNITWTIPGTPFTASGDSIFNLISAQYVALIQDANGCTARDTFNLDQPGTSLSLSFDTTDVSCVGADDGTVKVNVIGGTPGYSYNWIGTTFGNVDSIFALSPNTYRVSVTDANGCTGVDSTIINPATAISIVLDPASPTVDVTCAGDQDGTIDIIVSGGANTLVREWYLLPNRTTPIAGDISSVNNLSGGTYRVIVSDGTCFDSLDIAINEPDTLRATVNKYDISCDGTVLGRAAVRNITGGNPGARTFLWTPDPGIANGQGTDSVFNLTSGNYTVRVSDPLSCDTTIPFFISATSVTFNFTDSVRNDSCIGAGNGLVGIFGISGGVAPYTYEWSTNPGVVVNNSSIDNLATGTYSVIIRDNAGCDSTHIFSLLTEPFPFAFDFDTTDVNCAGADNGTIKLNLTGGTPPYSYNWIGTTFGNVDSIFGLATGTYRVAITDANGCTALDSTVINPATPILITVDPGIPSVDVTCAGDQDGTIDIITSGGANTLVREWYLLPNRTTPIAGDVSFINNLSGGTYRVIVSDGACADSLDIVINEPDTLKAAVNKYDLSCDGTILGRAAVRNITGGNPGARTFTWTPDPGIANGQGTDSIFNLAAGNYTVSVLDPLGCEALIPFFISATTVTFNFTDSVRNDSCIGAGKGFVGISGISGGVAPYTYEWSTNPGVIVNNPSIDNLTTGTYSVIIRDNAGCDSTHVFRLLTEPNPFAFDFDTTNVSCSGADNGTIKLNLTGGTPPYSYNWIGTTFGNVDSIFGLATGTYRLAITDANGCTALDSTLINPASPISIVLDPAIPSTDVTCAGDRDGTLAIIASGGGTTLVREWFLLPNRTTPIAGDVSRLTGLSGGTYRVIITDGPCLDSLDFIVNEPDTFKAELNSYNINCSGTVLGQAAVRNITGGNLGAPSFLWTPDPGIANGQGTDSVFNLAAGNYNVRVSDPLGCDTAIVFTISPTISNFTFIDSVRNDSCAGAGKGYVDIGNLSGGVPPYSFEWSTNPGVIVTDTFVDNLVAGNYSVTISDASGCDSVFDFRALTEPTPFSVSVIANEDTCLTSQGSAFIDPTSIAGGTPPYSFTWPGNITGQGVSGLLGNITYQLTITDANLCVYNEPFTIGNVAPFTISFETDSASCKGFNDGAIRVTTVGQASGVTTYTWTPSIPGGGTPTGLSAGTYSLNVTDANGCVATGFVDVEEPDELKIDSVNFTNETCVPGSDGTALAFTTGGNPAYRFNWGDGNGFSLANNVSTLTSGDYTVTVQDRKFCSDVFNFRVGVDAPFQIDSITIVDEKCAGDRDGSILVHLSDTIPVVSYNWNSSALSGPNPTGLGVGAYSLTVTDGTNCSVNRVIGVGRSSGVQTLIPLSEDETCSPGADGWATVGAVGGVEPYSFAWSPNVTFGSTSDSAFNLVADDYFVTTTDGIGCTSIGSVRLTGGANLDYNLLEQVVPLCFGDNNGKLRIEAFGGVGPYSYSWSNGSTDSIANNLRAGSVSVKITDSSTPACEKTFSITIAPVDPISLDFSTSIETCSPGSDGSVIVNPLGGVPPFTYTFSGTGTVGATPNVYENLTAGSYSVTVADFNGCSAFGNFSVGNASSLPFSASLTKKDPTCANGTDGSFNVQVNGGTNPFTYTWAGGNGNASAADPTSLVAGIYTVTVSDLYGCEVIKTDTLFNKAPITATFTFVKDDCPPTNTGSATAAAAGGVAPYTYNWPTASIPGSSASGGTFSNLPSGTFNLTVTDFKLCSNVIPFTIDKSAPFTLTTTKNNISCNGLTDGSITLSVSGVSIPNTEVYLWSTNVGLTNINNQSQTNLAAGTYLVTVTDPDNNCEETETFLIEEPDTIAATASLTSVTCSGNGNDGAINLTVTGGTEPYTYDWGSGVNSKNRNGLAVGDYTVIITDATNCSPFTATYTITNQPQFTVNLDSTDISCPGLRNGFITVTTTAVNPTYAWSDGLSVNATRGGLFAGKYIVTVTDGNTGCEVADSTIINEEDSIKMFFSVIDENCSPGMDGVANIDSTIGGTPGYSWSFSAGNQLGNGPVVNSLSAGTVFVTVTDLAGCRAVDSFEVKKAAPFDANFIFTDAICQGDSTGTASIITGNSTGPLTFTWPLGSVIDPTDSTQNKLLAGTYVVNVFDPSNQCDEDLTIIIDEPDTIKTNAIITDENCNPGGDGGITLIPSGGDGGPYTFSWLPAAGIAPTDQNQTGLAAGTYFLTITDGIGCTSEDSIEVEFIISTIPNLTTTDNGCQLTGPCTGSAKASPTNGVAPYSFEWESVLNGPITVPLTTDSIGGLCFGDYSLTITDASGCDTTIQFTIGGNRVITYSAVVTDETCGANNNGSIAVTPSGGDAPYSYTWLNSTAIDSLRTGLSPGNYRVTITDATGCTAVLDTTIETENFNYTLTSTDLSCNGGNDGTATISIVGGTTGYTFNWTPTPPNGQGTANVSNLSIGTYSVVITNTLNNCSATETFDISPNTVIDPNEVINNESCFGQNDGSIVLNVVGGAGGYTYNWSANVPAGTTGNSANGLSSGTYTVQIIDAANCDTTITVDIIAANDILASITENDATCTNSGICDGSAVLTVTSTGTFSYVWSQGITVIGNDSAAINLCPGNYFVDITNANGCIKRVNFVIGGPTAIDPNVTVTNSTCNIPNGSLVAAPTGGTGVLTVEWLDNTLASIGIGNPINNLPAGAYFIVVADAVGCTDTFPTQINDIGAENITITASNNVSCFGGNDGGATVSFVCNDPSCTTEWFALGGISVGTGRTITGLTEGDYYVEVSNNSGCLAVESINISQPSPFTISETIVSNDCANGINGRITLSVSGGAGNFNYLWSPSPTSGQGTNSVSGLAAGTYTVNIRDINGCDSTLSFDIQEPSEITSTFAITNSNCNQSDGQIVATVNGGTAALAYNYQWFNANNVLLIGETTDTLKNIAAGTYRLRVRDDNSCERIFTSTVSDLNGPTVVVDSVINAGCFGENGGGVFITASGTNPPFSFNWLPSGAVSEDLSNLTAGVYSVRVVDNLGCITNVEDTVKESTELMLSLTSADATCGQCNGTSSVSVSGGSAPYTYLWSNGDTLDNADSLCGGNYSLIVTDASGCSKSLDFGVNTTGGPTGETVSVSPASCANSNDGSASVIPIGGTPPYTYLWQHNGATTSTLSNLSAGIYFVQISDVRSCSRTVQIDITSPTKIELNPQVVSSECNQSNGSILLNVTGGQGPYSYNWGTATTADTNFIDGRAAGIYPVSVTDANGCIESLSIAINNTGTSFTPNPTATDISCFGQCDGSLVSNITNEPVDFKWLDAQRNSMAPLNTDLTNNVCAGDYFLEIITNPLGCKSYVSVTVSEPDSITLSSNIIKDISCNGDCDGQIFINTRGGNILYTYSWSDPNNQNQIPANGLCAGTYTVTATDANGCSATTSVTLTDPPIFTASITSNTNLICSSDCDATATSVANGGNPPYTFNWSGGQVVANPTNLCFGMNVLTVTDANNCSIMDTILISAIDTVIAESFGQPDLCDGDLVNLSGVITGPSITSFGWYLADTTTLLTTTLDTTFARPVGSYTYFLIATSGSCSDTATFNVNVAPNPVVNLSSEIRRFGEEVTIIELGNEDQSYSYSWTPSEDLDDSTKAEPTTLTTVDRTYTLLVTDTNGCTYTDSVLIVYSPNIEIPSGFTPNGDGDNDVWNIRLLEGFPNASVQIYNRWGQLLYEQPNGYNVPWNGEYNGKSLPIGTYYYIIELNDAAAKPVTGPITIVR